MLKYNVLVFPSIQKNHLSNNNCIITFSNVLNIFIVANILYSRMKRKNNMYFGL